MASVVDSIRAVYTDNYSMLKLGIFSYLIYFLLTPLFTAKTFNPAFWIPVLIVFTLYLGFCSIVIHNRIHQDLSTLPMINPVAYLLISVKAVAVLLPYLGIGLPLVNLVVGLFNFDGVPQQIAIGIIQLLVVSITITALIYYAKDYSIRDGYDLAKILSGFQDILVYVLMCILALAVVNVFIAVPLLYLTYSFLDIGPVFYYISTYLVTMNLAFLADYCGQLSFDLESRNNYY